ncbi:hypothetical protein N658DRAFT_202707 [Parathielavia hyrcaniae]|uniref:Uncharacterized protein n=1 Tax=Parathielavia hyrcaniae TaxID=113614 RepID=A0AAN6PZJ3_9PEZI|nr:hypothetical protein N658DRAFT_202707 [Parathielavia hyrcaniae]
MIFFPIDGPGGEYISGISWKEPMSCGFTIVYEPRQNWCISTAHQKMQRVMESCRQRSRNQRVRGSLAFGERRYVPDAARRPSWIHLNVELLLLLILHRRGLCLAQLEQAVPPRCFTCNASSPVLRLHSASAV